ncbi:MAG: hypothetical protein HUU08_11625 [Candidatus Brocadia sp.]|nr:hypothetical protein [Candidatus Brocadia sp.]
MLEIDKKKFIFKTKEIWFSDYPFDVVGYGSVSFRDCKNKVVSRGFSCEEFTTLVIDLTQDLDTIWKAISNRCRTRINNAKRSGVKIEQNKDYEEFYRINESFRRDKKLPLMQAECEFMKKYGTLFAAYLNGKMLSGYFVLEDKNTMRLLIGASRRLEVTKKESTLISNINRLIYWEAMKCAKEKGMKAFDLGGYYTGTKKDEEKEKINFFKRDFGGKVVTHYIYQKHYSILYKIVQKTYQIVRKGSALSG